MRRAWRPWEVEALQVLYPEVSTAKLAAVLGRTVSGVYGAASTLGLVKSERYMASPDACRLRRDQGRGVQFRFTPGHVPANKGVRRPGWAPGRMAETQFRKGQRSGRAAELWKPIGHERLTKEGYLQRKVTGTGNTVADYVEVHRLVWEEAHGPVPPGCAVIFKDGDRTNITIGNLDCLTRRELMLRNSSQRWGKEVFQLIQLRGAVNRKIRSLSEKQDVRPA